MNLEFSHKTKEIFFFERLFHSRFQTKQSFISIVGLCHLFSRGFNQNIMIFVKEITKKYKIYKFNYTCNRLPKRNLLKKSSEIDFSSGDILTSKKSRFQRILNRVRGKKKREISPSYFITPW